MEVPRGFTRCDECEGKGRVISWIPGTPGASGDPCPTCSGSGLVPTEKLRRDAAQAVIDAPESAVTLAGLSDAVLRKVAEHLGDRE